MDSVESVVVWSSASTVTHAPTSSAAAQMVRALSRATWRPTSGRDWPRADSLIDTSSGRAPLVSGVVSFPYAVSSDRYASTVAVAWAASVVSSPR